MNFGVVAGSVLRTIAFGGLAPGELRLSMSPAEDEKSMKDRIVAGAKSAGLEADWMLAIAYHESRLNPLAANLLGPDGARGGAYGLFQITLKTARAYGFAGEPDELLDPDTNIHWAGVIMGSARPSSLADACSWWNAGRKSAAALPDGHKTLTAYIPAVERALDKVQKGLV